MQPGAAQLEMHFQPSDGGGYANWQRDQEHAVRKIAEVWNLPLNKRVRLKLFNADTEFEGKLTLAEFPLSLDTRKPLLLGLDPMTFASTDVEECVVVE